MSAARLAEMLIGWKDQQVDLTPTKRSPLTEREDKRVYIQDHHCAKTAFEFRRMWGSDGAAAERGSG